MKTAGNSLPAIPNGSDRVVGLQDDLAGTLRRTKNAKQLFREQTSVANCVEFTDLLGLKLSWPIR
jgi:hypothetical protein